MGCIFHGACIPLEDFAPPTHWFSPDLGVETNHAVFSSRKVCMQPLLSLGPFSPKRSEAPSAPRPRGRKLSSHVLHCSIALEPFSVLYLPVPIGRRPPNPMFWTLYFFRLFFFWLYP